MEGRERRRGGGGVGGEEKGGQEEAERGGGVRTSSHARRARSSGVGCQSGQQPRRRRPSPCCSIASASPCRAGPCACASPHRLDAWRHGGAGLQNRPLAVLRRWRRASWPAPARFRGGSTGVGWPGRRASCDDPRSMPLAASWCVRASERAVGLDPSPDASGGQVSSPVEPSRRGAHNGRSRLRMGGPLQHAPLSGIPRATSPASHDRRLDRCGSEGKGSMSMRARRSTRDCRQRGCGRQTSRCGRAGQPVRAQGRMRECVKGPPGPALAQEHPLLHAAAALLLDLTTPPNNPPRAVRLLQHRS